MNQKELGELRRRFRPEKSAISRVYGCYVNSSREIVSFLDESLGRMAQEEAEKYLSLLKKSLSGTLGKQLIDIVFSTEQVMDSDEYRLLSALRESELKSGDIRQEFYRKVIESLDMGDSNYVILLAFDAYDVPQRGGDGESSGSETVFRYVLCCVCPVKACRAELGYFPGENEFHSSSPRRSWASSTPPLTDGRPTCTTPSSTPKAPAGSTRSLLTPFFAPRPPCPPTNSGSPSRRPCGRAWRRRAAWRWSSPSTSSCGSA